MQRFFLENLNTSNYSFTLKDKDLVNQILKVLRSKVWDKFIFFDWVDLYDYVFEIKEILKKEIVFEQVDRIKKESEASFEINLFQALPNKIDKVESIIKNWTQIWVSNFLFFKTERSQKLKISEAKQKRLNKIILESCEQCGRNLIPNLIIWEKINFSNLEWKNIFLHTKNSNSENLKDISVKENEIVNIFIWPEWGFSESEVSEFENNNFIWVFLWDRILRTELAWISSAFYLIQNNL